MRPPHIGSLYPVFVEPALVNAADGTLILMSSATACLYEYEQETFLITNWHVLSGKNCNDLKPLDGRLALPSEIRVHFPIANNLSECSVKTYPLNNSNGDPIWLEHELSNKIDVAALKIDIPEGIASFPVSEAFRQPGTGARENFFYVTQDVWVVGYPKGIRVGNMPIWKRATIAAETRFSSQAHRHKVILDTATREGMSGSPVLYVDKNLTPITFDGTALEVDLPSAKVLLGIYSGRIMGNDELAAQLGIVWAAEAIVEILTRRQAYVPKNNQPSVAD